MVALRARDSSAVRGKHICILPPSKIYLLRWFSSWIASPLLLSSYLFDRFFFWSDPRECVQKESLKLAAMKNDPAAMKFWCELGYSTRFVICARSILVGVLYDWSCYMQSTSWLSEELHKGVAPITVSRYTNEPLQHIFNTLDVGHPKGRHLAILTTKML